MRLRKNGTRALEEQLVDALTDRARLVHGEMLALQLQRLQLIDQQMAQLNSMIAASHEGASGRRDSTGGIAWFGCDSAQQSKRLQS
jgi:hypothetical protein